MESRGPTQCYGTPHLHVHEVAKTLKTGFLVQLQASDVFHAFTFEAYLNYVGSREIEFWDEINRIPQGKYDARLIAGL